ncbi:fructosamine kinase family protein [Tamlana sp. 2_MG-2023]|uniref:fructosamine kinase family protein n=1 Tax=unclassified Tamlana TaxID=2614803 RepID=UPI0026E3788F|nr:MULTISPECIES: fructosamine kinase family protein [unclassified Tamlana]MDO6760084.1 fructosamine kinase family protein [Tamlana sp. 2_MG-2023]MDO6790218.1 fructosamine kinase family protein [Tamlana sp. 1_MG-2023]
MDSALRTHISEILNKPIHHVIDLQGGDISHAYKISSDDHAYFLKTNEADYALDMFQSEAASLKEIRSTNTIKTPEILGCGAFNNLAFLLLDYIPTKTADASDFKILGKQLAQLHQTTQENFGFSNHNFIGKLTQSNTEHDNWLEFYTYERLLPQLKLATEKSLLKPSETPSEAQILSVLKPLFENIKPSLIHGDLWSGNYLISENDVPYLIDPAAYYGHYEIDIAMSQLFGGFDQEFYEAYLQEAELEHFNQKRIEIYQLYFLLVHLNMFGYSYYTDVIHIIRKYF